MQIPLKWINELVNIKSINLDNLIDKLTLGGFEVEEIIELKIENKKQLALDVTATANRSDSLSIQGISTEIITLLNTPVKISKYSLKKINWKKETDNFSKIISNQYDCSAIVAIIVENLTNIKTPRWIKQKLLSSNVILTDTLLDFENYILLETGYTFAFYDFSKICSKINSSNFTLSLSKANNNEKFVANNELTYELNSSTTIIKANSSTISIAGIIESKDCYYSDNTNALMIEASIFNAGKIRQQSRYLGLRTNRSARYEKSLKSKYLIEALYRLISLLRISNPNLTCKLHTTAQIFKEEFSSIFLNYQTVKEILGPIEKINSNKNFNYITPEIITDYLTRLNFQFLYNDSKLIWEVQIPELRNDDITREIDLVEEIGRLHGFNNFLMTLPKVKKIGNEDFSYKIRKKITSCFLNLGFNEFIHYSLVNKTTFLNNEVSLVNPLLSDCSNLRSSLLPNLIKTVQENLKQGNLSIEGFEYGHVFSGNILENFKEKEYVTGIFGGIKKKLNWSHAEKVLTWFESKGKIEQFFKQLDIPICWQTKNSSYEKILHPYRSAEIYLTNGIKIGVFGQIHPILSNQLVISSEIYLFEFDVEILEKQIRTNKLTIYKEYSLYPKIVKDLSFIIEDHILFKELQTALYFNGTEFLTEINLLDEYVGNFIPDKHKSLCLKLVFQSKKKTLKNKEIENIINNLQLVLVSKFNAIIRN